jgi:hypothetical protein
VKIHVSLTSALVEGEWSAPRSGRFTPRGKGPQYPLDRRLGEPQKWSGRHGEVKILDPQGLEIRPLRRPESSQSLYQLSYPGLHMRIEIIQIYFSLLTET